MTIEASLIVPLIIIAAVIMILGLVFIYEREYLRAQMYDAAYSVPYEAYDSDDGIRTYINEMEYGEVNVYGTSLIRGDSSSGQLLMTGEIEVKGRENIEVSREIGKCSSRLRRWQMYDSITEE